MASVAEAVDRRRCAATRPTRPAPAGRWAQPGRFSARDERSRLTAVMLAQSAAKRHLRQKPTTHEGELTCPRPRSRGRCSRPTAASAPDPSKVRPDGVRLAGVRSRPAYLGTSHRRAGVRDVVGRVRAGLADAVRAPRRLRGRRSATAARRRSSTWRRSASSSAEASTARSATSPPGSPPRWPPPPTSRTPRSSLAEAGTRPAPIANDAVDTYALTHNETSTGVAMPVDPPAATATARAATAS